MEIYIWSVVETLLNFHMISSFDMCKAFFTQENCYNSLIMRLYDDET